MAFPTRHADKLQGACICQTHSVQSSLHGLVSPKQEGKAMAKDYKGPLDYIDVATRIVEFREKYPTGSLQQVKVEFVTVNNKDWVIYTAAAYRTPDDIRPGMGTAWEPIPGPTPFTRDSEVQNAETAAWGRAMVAALAVDTKKGIASSEEVRNRQTKSADAPQAKTPAVKREYTDTEILTTGAVMELIAETTDLDELKSAWQLNADLLDCAIDGITLRDAILAKKNAING